MTKKKLLEAIKKVEHDSSGSFPNKGYEQVEAMFSDISQIIELPFELVSRCDGSGMDWWLQCEYWSKKLNKVIIWDYDFRDSFESKEDFADEIIKTIKEITAFEKRISLDK